MSRTAGGHQEERTYLREKMPKVKKFGGRKKRRGGAKTEKPKPDPGRKELLSLTRKEPG